MGRLVILTFLPIYLQEHLHYSAFALGVFVALMHALGTISQPALGLLSDRFGRKAVLVPSCLLLGLFFALLAIVPAGIPLALVIIAIGLFFYTLFNIMNAAVMDVAGSARSGIDLWAHDPRHPASCDSDTYGYRIFDRRIWHQVLVCSSGSFSHRRRPSTGATETLPGISRPMTAEDGKGLPTQPSKTGY